MYIGLLLGIYMYIQFLNLFAFLLTGVAVESVLQAREHIINSSKCHDIQQNLMKIG